MSKIEKILDWKDGEGGNMCPKCDRPMTDGKAKDVFCVGQFWFTVWYSICGYCGFVDESRTFIE